MASEEDYGFEAYLDIQAELGQWGEESPAPTTPGTHRHSPGLRRRYDYQDGTPPSAEPATPASARRSKITGGNGGGDDDDDDDDDDDGMEEGHHYSSPAAAASVRATGAVGVQTPEPTVGGHHDGGGTLTDYQNDDDDDEGEAMNDHADDDDDFMATAEQLIGDGTDAYRPYHDALFHYLRSKERASELILEREEADDNDGNDVSMMQIDEDDDDDDKTRARAEMEDAEMKFLESLASVCASRGRTGGGAAVVPRDEASANEGNFWDLLAALRSSGGSSSLFYCVDGEEVPELTLADDPAAMAGDAPADVLNACIGGEERDASPPLRRLAAALGWIESCHGRRFEDALADDDGRGEDPMLPPPRRRSMWPGAAAELRRRPERRSAGTFHPDAPYRAAFSGGRSSAGDASSVLTPEDRADDARLLRACFMLLQSGRLEEAVKLATDCGQPHLAAGWTGGAPLSADGTSGNPNRRLWKNQCRTISRTMSRLADKESSPAADEGGGELLHPSAAYEAAILALLSDDAEGALRNPVFRTWEDGVHAVLSAEMGILEDDILRSHDGARSEAAEANGGRFPHAGTEQPGSLDGGHVPRGNDGDLLAALDKLESCPLERVREESADPFRYGMTSFLAGRDAPREFMEECGALSLEAVDEDEASFLRFVTHLVLYADSILPEFSARLALPEGVDAAADGDIFSLRELLILKYVAYLSSRRELWQHVALYASLLSEDNILDTYSSFLIRVHSDRERQMTLRQARELFPRGLDLYILRNVVRGMILRDGEEEWVREPGEEVAPAGVTPAEARMMRSINWLCYHPEHMPDALVGANMLLRRFLLSHAEDDTGRQLYAPKVFIERILPKDILDVAVEQSHKEEENVAGFISYLMVQNLEAEYLSIESFLKAHTKYVQFLDGISKTSPCHTSNRIVEGGSRSNHETEIADKMERNAFRQKKMGLCKIIIELASRVSDALTEVLAFAGGWLIDVNSDFDEDESETDEAKVRSEELEAIRAKFVPMAVFMLQEVLDKTGMWLEQVVYDTLAQFGSASEDMLLTLYSSFDKSYRSNNEDLTMELLATSLAAPGYWHKKAVSLSSIVANDGYGLHETFTNEAMDNFLSLMAESYIKLYRCSNDRTLFDC